MANPQFRPYGANPYRGYDTSGFPFLYDGDVPDGIAPLDRVVVVDGKVGPWISSNSDRHWSAMGSRLLGSRGRTQPSISVISPVAAMWEP